MSEVCSSDWKRPSPTWERETVAVGFWVIVTLRAGIALNRCYIGQVLAVDDRGVRIMLADFPPYLFIPSESDNLFVQWAHIGAVLVLTPDRFLTAHYRYEFLITYRLWRSKFDGIPMPKDPDEDEEEAEAEAECERAAQDAADAADMADALAQMGEQPSPIDPALPPWRKQEASSKIIHSAKVDDVLRDGDYRSSVGSFNVDAEGLLYQLYFSIEEPQSNSTKVVIPKAITVSRSSGFGSQISGPGIRYKGNWWNGAGPLIRLAGCVPTNDFHGKHDCHEFADYILAYTCDVVEIISE